MSKDKKAKKLAKKQAEQNAAYEEFIALLDALSLQSSHGEVNNSMNYSRLANVAALVAFGAAVLGNTLFGAGGVELVAAGLFLHAGADTLEDILS